MTVKKRILIINDKEMECRILTILLKKYNPYLKTDVTCDGETAKRMLMNEGPYDMVITDLMMPGVSGYDIIDFLRSGRLLVSQKSTSPEAVIIVCSACPPSSINDRGDYYISKPIQSDELEKIMDQALESIQLP